MCKHGEGGGAILCFQVPHPAPARAKRINFADFYVKNLNIFMENSTGSRAKNVLNQEHMMGECVDFLLPFPSFLPPGQQKCEEKKRKKNVKDIFLVKCTKFA